jgi:hypothetical protein
LGIAWWWAVTVQCHVHFVYVEVQALVMDHKGRAWSLQGEYFLHYLFYHRIFSLLVVWLGKKLLASLVLVPHTWHVDAYGLDIAYVTWSSFAVTASLMHVHLSYFWRMQGWLCRAQFWLIVPLLCNCFASTCTV